jgi:hypothetical protein
MKHPLRLLLFAVAAAGVASPAAAGELTVKMADGLVTVIAKDVPLRQILAEWARVGDTRMVNAEKLGGTPLTLELVGVPEKEALDILLRSAAGYMTASRPAGLPGASVYDRVIILATSRPPANTPVPPPQTFRPAVQQQLPPQPPPDDDDGEPQDQGPMPPPGIQNPGMPFPGPTPATPGMNPGAVPPNMPQAPLTSPRPGMLPQPMQPGPTNPYIPVGPNGRPIGPNGQPIGPNGQPIGPNGQPLPGPGGRVGGPGVDDDR